MATLVSKSLILMKSKKKRNHRVEKNSVMGTYKFILILPFFGLIFFFQFFTYVVWKEICQKSSHLTLNLWNSVGTRRPATR